MQRPSWLRGNDARVLIPLFLAGSWHDSNDADGEVLATLAPAAAERVQATAVTWSLEADAPIRSVGHVYFASEEDAWRLLAPSLTRGDLERFEHAVLSVLGTRDPRFDLVEDERWLSVERPPHSSALREGLAAQQSLVASLVCSMKSLVGSRCAGANRTNGLRASRAARTTREPQSARTLQGPRRARAAERHPRRGRMGDVKLRARWQT